MSSNYKRKYKDLNSKKKILDDFDSKKINTKQNEVQKDFDAVLKEIKKDIIEEEFNSGKEKEKKINNIDNTNRDKNIEKLPEMVIDNSQKINDINNKIQSVVSVLFTIVIFILIVLLIIILYDKYLKKEKDVNLDEICNSYIKTNIEVSNEEIFNYIKENRHIIYNIEDYSDSNINNKTINEFSKFIIWNNDTEYTICDDSEYCLDTKKEMEYELLKEELEKYFDIDTLNLIVDYDFNNNDTTRLYLNNEKVVLTFKNMEYSTFKHDIVDIRIDENKVYVIFALSKMIDNSNNYAYTGYKNLELEYSDNKFIIKNIKINLI